MSKGRKPSVLMLNGNQIAYCGSSRIQVRVATTSITPYQARRLADWLHRAAEWIEGKEEGR